MNYFSIKNWPVIVKLSALIAVSILPLILVYSMKTLPEMEEKVYQGKRDDLRHLTESASGILKAFDAKAAAGILSREAAQKAAVEEIQLLRYEGKEYFFIYDMNGITQALGSDPSKVGTNRYDLVDPNGVKFIQEMINVCKQNGKGFVEYSYPKLGETEPLPKLTYVLMYEPWGWIIGTGVYVDDVAEEIDSFNSEIRNYLIMAIVLAVVLGFIISRSIGRPIRELNRAASEVASGNVDISVDAQGSDEIGQLGNSFNTMILNIKKLIDQAKRNEENAHKLASEADTARKNADQQQKYLSNKVDEMLVSVGRFAEGDLTVNLVIEKQDEIGKLFSGFNNAVEKIRIIVERIKMMSSELASSSTEITSSAEALAGGASEQSGQTNDVASAIEQMSTTIISTSKNATNVSEEAKHAGEIAKDGGVMVQNTYKGIVKIADVVGNASDTISKLGASSDQIGDIITVIEDIADQTNLLALNAAIEAARAGEQGRGFAVVADEVRKLAERTTKATKEISGMIKQIQAETKSAVDSIKSGTEVVSTGKELAQKAGDSLAQIIRVTEKVMDEVVQVAAASEEQSTAAEEISRSVVSINTITQQSADGIREIAGAAEDLNRLIEKLNEMVDGFRISADQGGRYLR